MLSCTFPGCRGSFKDPSRFQRRNYTTNFNVGLQLFRDRLASERGSVAVYFHRWFVTDTRRVALGTALTPGVPSASSFLGIPRVTPAPGIQSAAASNPCWEPGDQNLLPALGRCTLGVGSPAPLLARAWGKSAHCLLELQVIGECHAGQMGDTTALLPVGGECLSLLCYSRLCCSQASYVSIKNV